MFFVMVYLQNIALFHLTYNSLNVKLFLGKCACLDKTCNGPHFRDECYGKAGETGLVRSFETNPFNCVLVNRVLFSLDAFMNTQQIARPK